ncbi:SpoIIIAH-like family protein [Oceanobacillus massiliensis]|uniref:SpoIIIAH-like family protein n=1 Tax=Oceanobacillus massiliensis TaxID=1465765 RepID=UPI0002888970|nr:SpoIIIAH-like family protein [Oceanobacillus massiliensis]
MLKKQTVWLLTMLSLMIVLSVYYVLSPNSEDLAYIEDGQEETEETSTTETGDDADVSNISSVGQDELFTTIRMEINDERSMKKGRLTEIVASASADTQEKEQALEEIDVLEELSTKETILEEQIVGATGYDDVLVRSDGTKVHVHVKADTLTETEVVDIMQMVRDEFGEITAEVNFQPTGE